MKILKKGESIMDIDNVSSSVLNSVPDMVQPVGGVAHKSRSLFTSPHWRDPDAKRQVEEFIERMETEIPGDTIPKQK